jgi:hypothetical protein
VAPELCSPTGAVTRWPLPAVGDVTLALAAFAILTWTPVPTGGAWWWRAAVETSARLKIRLALFVTHVIVRLPLRMWKLDIIVVEILRNAQERNGGVETRETYCARGGDLALLRSAAGGRLIALGGETYCALGGDLLRSGGSLIALGGETYLAVRSFALRTLVEY